MASVAGWRSHSFDVFPYDLSQKEIKLPATENINPIIYYEFQIKPITQKFSDNQNQHPRQIHINP
jgi:hypothetical protein